MWENAQGEEYDLLRLLPPETAGQVWLRAFRKGFRRLLRTWWFWPLGFIFGNLLSLSIMFVWGAVAMLGIGWVGQVLGEVVVHLFLAAFLGPVFTRHLPRFLQPFIREELFLLAEQEQSKRREAIAPPA